MLEYAGPLKVLQTALHKTNDPSKKAFICISVAASKAITTAQGNTIAADKDFKDAHRLLRDVDVVVVPGGSPDAVMDIDKDDDLVKLVRAFGDMQKNNPIKERTLLSISSASMILAKAGALQGFTATTHPDLDIKLEKTCQEASAYAAVNRTEVIQETYVVNNARFDLGDPEENPFVIDRRDYETLSHKQRRRSSIARKGSDSWKASNTFKDGAARRAQLRLGGLRVITSNAGTAGLDAALYVVCAMASEESAQDVARGMSYEWRKGVVVDSLDV
ncbi:MAG: hypothetical protein Q9162_007399 [Coniocarpon cinnabarinum]